MSVNLTTFHPNELALEQSCWDQAAAWLPDVESVMRQTLTGGRVERCGRMARDVLEAGGRRVRARLALVASIAMGVPRSDAIAWAAAVELVHNATLVHDDIQDADRLRRGRETLWVKEGIGQAINAGDLMLMVPHLALDRMQADHGTRWLLSRALAYRSGETARGQSEDMSLLGDRLFDWASYVRVAEGKSGQLLGLPVEGACLLAGEDAEVAAAISDLYATLGTLFQLQDDVLDLYGPKGRAAGGDLREGKVTALVVAHLTRHPSDTDEIVALLEAPGDEISDAVIEDIRHRFRTGGALADVRRAIDGIRYELEESLLLLERPALRQVALEFADWIVAELNSHTELEEA